MLMFVVQLFAQKSIIFTHDLKAYNHAYELYQNENYLASQAQFTSIKDQFEKHSEMRANCEFYIADCAIKLSQPDSDYLMNSFVDDYPTSTLRNNAFENIAEHYFSIGKYGNAAKWYEKVDPKNVAAGDKEQYLFNYGYSSFVVNKYDRAKGLFSQLLKSKDYSSEAAYYNGYIAYKQDDYEVANNYFQKVMGNGKYKDNLDYFLVDMSFNKGEFETTIEQGVPLLKKTKRRDEFSELSKIIGESYFNLKRYEEALPYLNNYRGKRGKWNNTDYYMLGYTNYQLKDFEKAVNNFNKIVDGDDAVAQNAYYHLAFSYLKLDKKTAALNAFKNALEMSYDEEIQEDAWYNYAKLSYEIGNPYQNLTEVLKEYSKKYANSSRGSEVKDLVANSYLISKDYEGALAYLSQHKNTKSKDVYQLASYAIGIQKFNKEEMEDAEMYFTKAINNPSSESVLAKALFWRAESYAQQRKYQEAIDDYNTMDALKITNKALFNESYYNKGYALYKTANYEGAITSFNKFIENSDNDEKESDAYQRVADSYFAMNNYQEAISNYSKAIKKSSRNMDYAVFHRAISYGFEGDEDKKIRSLSAFVSKEKKSSYLDDAYYVMANTYVKKGRNKEALENYNLLINNFRRSPLVPKAMLRKALIYYNDGENDQAIDTYKEVVTNYPNTPFAQQAVKSARQIYVDTGKIDEYATWVKQLDFIKISDSELENDTYEAAEKQYLQYNYTRAIIAFKKYLSKYPKGTYLNQSNFYLAQSLFEENKYNEAIPYYSFVNNLPSNEFSETVMARLSLIYLKKGNWKEVIPLLKKLETDSAIDKNVEFAQANLMKAFDGQNDTKNAVSYAKKVVTHKTATKEIKSDAYLLIARDAYQSKKMADAKKTYKKLMKSGMDEAKAEAHFYDAYFEHLDGSYRVSNDKIQKLAADFSSYKYWSAKGLVIMAKNFYELKDAFQANYILESVIKNFGQYKDVVKDAQSTLRKIKEEQAKTNESIKG
jgi:TolA-binding protein